MTFSRAGAALAAATLACVLATTARAALTVTSVTDIQAPSASITGSLHGAVGQFGTQYSTETGLWVYNPDGTEYGLSAFTSPLPPLPGYPPFAAGVQVSAGDLSANLAGMSYAAGFTSSTPQGLLVGAALYSQYGADVPVDGGGAVTASASLDRAFTLTLTADTRMGIILSFDAPPLPLETIILTITGPGNELLSSTVYTTAALLPDTLYQAGTTFKVELIGNTYVSGALDPGTPYAEQAASFGVVFTPEPSTLGFLGAGAAALLLRRRRR